MSVWPLRKYLNACFSIPSPSMLPFPRRRIYQVRNSTWLIQQFCWSRWGFLLSTLCAAVFQGLRRQSSWCWQSQSGQSGCKTSSSKPKVSQLSTEGDKAKWRKRRKKCWSCSKPLATKRVSSWFLCYCCYSICHSLSTVHRSQSYTTFGFFSLLLIFGSVKVSKVDWVGKEAATCFLVKQARCFRSLCM